MKSPDQLPRIRRHTRLLMLAWTLVTGLSLAFGIRQHEKAFYAEIQAQARGIHTMDSAYRNWVIGYGGIYVPVTKHSEPNPFLKDVPERDITTPSGKKLTLFNSSYMTRQVHELMDRQDSSVRGHISSLRPLNPKNRADPWEADALRQFEKGVQEKSGIVKMKDGKEYFRFMKPMYMEESCLKCHSGYRVGDVRGGISVSIPIDAPLAIENDETRILWLGHGMIWGLGLLGLFAGGKRQQQAVESIAKSEAEVRLLANSIAHAIYGQDMNGLCTFANASCIELLGYREERDLLGKNMHALMHHSHADGSPYPEADCPILKTAREARPFHSEEEVVWKRDGSSFPAAYWAYPVMPGGKCTGVVVTFLDITEQKKVSEALAGSRRLLDSIVEHIPSMVFLKNAQNLRFELFNRAGERLLGHSREDLLGKSDLELFPKEQAEFFMKKDREVLEGRNVVEIQEEPVMTASGEEIWLHTSKIGLYDEEGKPTHLLGISMDITERRKMEEERELAIREKSEHLARLRETLHQTISAISRAIEARDPYTAGHQRRVAEIACEIAGKMGLDADRIEGIRMGATIHDIGKIQVPSEMLANPTNLAEMEILILREHPRVGYEILKDVRFPWPVAEIALQHHERMDGSGYPQGLSGEDILLEARIVAVADVLEAMSSSRPYRPALGMEAALREIGEGRGRIYDADAVDACLSLYRT
ncbi:MAG: PAS domain S-box protein [Burkholderiales bacterium]|nr:PAS domain S-box protein [Burkholderiales bacterium]